MESHRSTPAAGRASPALGQFFSDVRGLGGRNMTTHSRFGAALQRVGFAISISTAHPARMRGVIMAISGARWAGAVVCIGAIVSSCSGNPTPTPSSAATSSGSAATSSGSTPLSVPQAKRLAGSLTSADRRQVSTVLSAALAETYLNSPDQILPPGSNLSLEVSQMRVTADHATVPARLTGPLSGQWQLYLVLEHGTWRLLSAVPVR